MKNKVPIYIKLDSVYNKAIEQYRESIKTWPAGYTAEFCSNVRKISNEDLQKYNETNKILEKIKGDPLVDFLMKNNIPLELETLTHSSHVTVNREPHHFNFYAVIYVDKKYIHSYYKNLEKKSFVFKDNKLVSIKKE